MSITLARAEIRNAFRNGTTAIEGFQYADSGTHQGNDWVKVDLRRENLTSEELYNRSMENLKAFVERHEVSIGGTQGGFHLVNNPDIFIYRSYWITENELSQSNQDSAALGRRITNNVVECFCGEENDSLSTQCTNCDETFLCPGCYQSPLGFFNSQVFNAEGHRFRLWDHGCNSCTNLCSECGENFQPDRSAIGIVNDGETRCRDCHPRFACRRCMQLVEGDSGDSGGYCAACLENCCSQCHNVAGDRVVILNDETHGRICNICFGRLEENQEVFDESSEMTATKLAIPTIDGRENIRFCGIEIEGVDVTPDAHNILAMDLYDAGLSQSHRRTGYHDGRGLGFAHVERDSSCDWEVVAGPINMASATHVRNLNKVIRIVRARIKSDDVKLSMNCGLHIHVSGEKVGTKQAHVIHLLYTYLEDVIWRLGAAKWPMHRAVVNGDGVYTVCPRKDTPLEFVNHYSGNRYFGLSFSNYFDRIMNHCGCGASRFGMFEDCTCQLAKCTFEFRMFNTTANTLKIHAYIALTQALVSKGLGLTEFDLGAMPAQNFNMRNFKDMTPTEQENIATEWSERMKYILEELPLTQDERNSILYCVDSSELSAIGQYCRELVENQEVNV